VLLGRNGARSLRLLGDDDVAALRPGFAGEGVDGFQVVDVVEDEQPVVVFVEPALSGGDGELLLLGVGVGKLEQAGEGGEVGKEGFWVFRRAARGLPSSVRAGDERTRRRSGSCPLRRGR
jgi:hypothetical protein